MQSALGLQTHMHSVGHWQLSPLPAHHLRGHRRSLVLVSLCRSPIPDPASSDMRLYCEPPCKISDDTVNAQPFPLPKCEHEYIKGNWQASNCEACDFDDVT